MNVKELSEGDYVSYGGKYVFPVEHICWDGTVCPNPKGPRFGLPNRITPDCIDPIPLTPKFLEANGFSLLHGYWHKDMKHYGRTFFASYHYSKDEDRCILMVGDIDREVFNFRINRVAYVHVLQHLLRICGIDERLEVTDDMVRDTEGD